MTSSFKIIELMSISVIAKTRSLIRSAELLGISQPNLSRAITAIEENIGLKIFDRTTRPLQLTEFGKSLLPYVTNHINSHSQLIDYVEHYKQSSSGVVRLHAPTGQLFFFAKYIIPKLQSKHPEIVVELCTQNLSESEYLEGLSFNFGCDILFTHALPKNTELVANKITSMKANIYGSDDFILNHPVNSIHDYRQYPCILYSSFMEERTNAWSFIEKESNKDVRIFVTGNYICDNAYTALELARYGTGYLYAPDFLIYEMGCSSSLLPTLPSGYTASISNYMIYHRRTHQPYRVEVVIQLINEIVSERFDEFNNTTLPQ